MKIHLLWSEQVSVMTPEETWDICLMHSVCAFVLFSTSFDQETVTIQ